VRGPRVLLVDNYDSFVGNLYQYLGELGAEPHILRNDRFRPADVEASGYTHIVISPGPKTPEEAGVSVELVRTFAGRIPILGVCLGHQAIGVAFGGRVVQARRLVHGKTSEIHHRGEGVFAGLPSPFTATRYHSLALHRGSLPAELAVTAWTDDGEIMGIRHRERPRPVEGVQFHPESILTEHGRELLANFLRGPR
jgi:anthranilate synthase component 2